MNVSFPCGCTYQAKHQAPAERLVTCEHGRQWVVSAHKPTHTHYHFREATKENNDG